MLVKQIEITEPRCDDRIFSSDTCEIKYCWCDPPPLLIPMKWELSSVDSWAGNSEFSSFYILYKKFPMLVQTAVIGVVKGAESLSAI